MIQVFGFNYYRLSNGCGRTALENAFLFFAQKNILKEYFLIGDTRISFRYIFFTF